ncbi:conserved Plasmodium protein, unknown function [Plasmodium relictum]|uniref:MORN repeat protein n=1 Tax=Plasmodium relictum TaxID=85471 RepID=A0A1J1HDZ1_PLARL|nr:conserved Plasmodium protein, unknown function [Plasmodium relictum]CRH04015.1 conserved Plasmodium protein, unknown function [Plasmodium relictum]
MSEETLCKQDSLNFLLNEEDEFINIFNYKNIKCFKSPHYIYIGQIRNNESFLGKENICEDIYKKNDDIKKDTTKEYAYHKEKLEKKKKKIIKYIKEGYGILLSLRKNIYDEEIIVNKFIGNWKNDKKNGLGLNIFLNKNIFFGYYENDLRNGWGYLEWKNSSSKFQGYWLNNSINGKGMYSNKYFSYDGNFYNNKFLNSCGEWMNIFELEKNNKTHANNNIISNNIHLILLPFDFIKAHLKKIVEIIKHNFNKVPFIMCTKKFIEKNKNFNLSKFVFLSYYFDSSELLHDFNEKLFFDNFKNNNSENKKIEKVGFKKSNYNHDNLSSFENSTTSEINNELNSSHYFNNSIESYDSDNSKGSYEFNNSNNHKNSNESDYFNEFNDSNEYNNFSEPNNSNDSCPNVNYSTVSNYSNDSNDSFNFQLKKNNSSNGSNSISLKTVCIYGNESDKSELKEYLKNERKSSDLKNKSFLGSFSKNNDNLKIDKTDFKKSCNFNSGKIYNTSINLEEKRKNKIHNLINSYLNMYIDTDDSLSNYSIMSSETEVSDDSVNSKKIEKKENDIQEENDTDKRQEKHKEEEEKERKSEKKKKKMNNKFVEMVKNDEECNSFDVNRKIEEELPKIKVDISFLIKIINMNLSCKHIIKKKIKNSLLLKYPFIFNLNISENKNKYENIDNELLLENCKIPEFWDLKSYFCNIATKLPEEIFSPLYFDLNNSYKSIIRFSKLEEKNMNDNLSEKKFCNNFNLNFFVITDLLVDETKDVYFLKELIKNKFNNYSYLNSLFFLIIE